MKFVLPLLASLASLLAMPAFAQRPSGHFDAAFAAEPDTQVLAFLRIPFGEQKKPAKPRIGFGIFADCDDLSARLSSARASGCDSQTVRSLQASRELDGRAWLISFSGDRRWVGIARWVPGLGFARDNSAGPVLSGPIAQPRLQGPPN